ncbi:MAG: SpoIIE family protein phosphatase [Treponema sp.]|nr:SpoIIE family protein phosphatase [Treponema sp.]
MTGKRISIRQKIRRIVLSISMAALVLTGAVGCISMLRIRSASRAALIEQTENLLTQQVHDKAAVAESEFSLYANYAQFLSDYIHTLYRDASSFAATGYLVPPPVTSTAAGVYTMQRTFSDGHVSLSAVRKEIKMLSHLEQFLVPFMAANGAVVTTCYAATTSGVMISYDAWASICSLESNGECYYNYFESDWYSRGTVSQKPFFTDVYEDAFGRGLMITCAVPFFDSNDVFAGVVAMDVLITDLYDDIVKLGEGVSAFLVDASGTVISPSADVITSELELQELTSLLRATENQLAAFGSTFYAHARIAATGWTLCFAVPQSLVFNAAKPIQYTILTSMLLFLLIFLFVIFVVCITAGIFSVTVSNPVNHLRRDVEMISKGMLSHRADVIGNDEISDLSESINMMADALQTYTDIVLEKERLDTELEIAMRIQMNMLPDVADIFPRGNKNFDLDASMTCAKEVGGDFYDFFLIDSDHLALVIADVAGKGVPAALLMVTAKTLIKSQTLAGGSPADIFTRVNKLLCIENKSELFVTAWLGILELSTGKLVGVNAGHEKPAFKRAGGMYSYIVTEHNPPLGSIPDVEYVEYTFMLSSGDRLFLYTDGLAEAKNAEMDEFGLDRMLTVLNHNLLTRPKELLKEMLISVRAFADEKPQYDDITMLSLHYMHS